MSSTSTVWCPCRSDPEPTGPWIYPDDWHADAHHDDLEPRRQHDRNERRKG